VLDFSLSWIDFLPLQEHCPSPGWLPPSPVTIFPCSEHEMVPSCNFFFCSDHFPKQFGCFPFLVLPLAPGKWSLAREYGVFFPASFYRKIIPAPIRESLPPVLRGPSLRQRGYRFFFFPPIPSDKQAYILFPPPPLLVLSLVKAPMGLRR